MQFKILKDDKNELEAEIDNLTITELLRVYLVKDDNVSFAAWRKEHPDKNPIIKIKTKTKTAKKALKDAINIINKELDKVSSDFKKSAK